MRKHHLIALIVLMLIFNSCSTLLFWRNSYQGKSYVGDFVLYDKKGRSLKLSDLQDRIVVLHFWSWG